MNVWKRVIGAGAIVGALIVGAGSVDAGAQHTRGDLPATGQLDVNVRVLGLEATSVDSVIPEVYTSGGVYLEDCDTPGPFSFDDTFVGSRNYSCELATGTYTLGASSAPAGYTLEAVCFGPSEPERFIDPTVEFTIQSFGFTQCNIIYSTIVLLLDKEVADPNEFGEPLADTSDFTLEVWDDVGQPFMTGTDPSAAQCDDVFAASSDDCLIMDLPDGDYVLGEVAVDGYDGYVSSCTTGFFFDEQFPGPDAQITAATSGDGEYIHCVIRNDYAEGNVTLTKTLTNDDGGTAAVGDFTLELFDEDGTKIDEGVCADTGVCLQGSYPVGDYVVGEVGPSGYTRTVTQIVEEPTEPLTDPNAAFTLAPFGQITVQVASDDIAPTTTTTTTVAPTTVAPTTVAPTTVAPTTTMAIGAGAATLPATGQSDRSGPLAAVALIMLLIGGAAIWTSRRAT